MTELIVLNLVLKAAPKGKDPCRLCVLQPQNLKCNIVSEEADCENLDRGYWALKVTPPAKKV